MKTTKTTFILFATYVITLLLGVAIGMQHNKQAFELQTKVAFLINEGYSVEASEHIAKVELNIIPEDEFYTMLKED